MSNEEQETILKHVEFTAPSRFNVSREKWVIALTNKRLVAYCDKGAGIRTLIGALVGAGMGLGIALVITLVSSAGKSEYFLPRFAVTGAFSAILFAAVGAKMRLGGKQELPYPSSVDVLEQNVKQAKRSRQFTDPTQIEYKMRSQFMGGIALRLGNRGPRFSFAHDPLYSDVKLMIERFTRQKAERGN
jgi:hypothetical protein